MGRWVGGWVRSCSLLSVHHSPTLPHLVVKEVLQTEEMVGVGVPRVLEQLQELDLVQRLVEEIYGEGGGWVGGWVGEPFILSDTQPPIHLPLLFLMIFKHTCTGSSPPSFPTLSRSTHSTAVEKTACPSKSRTR